MAKKKVARAITSQNVIAKPPHDVPIPFRDVDALESITLGFKMGFISTDKGGIFSGAGMGSPWLTLEWDGRRACVHAVELLAAWVQTFNPEEAKKIREATIVGGLSVTAAEAPVE